MKRRLDRLAFLTGVVVSFWSGLVLADESPRDLETYGDSITAAFLSGTSVTSPPPLSGEGSVSEIVTDLANYLFNGEKEKLVKHHAPDVAWPVLLGKQLAASGEKFAVKNYAVSGARVKDLSSQVSRSSRTSGYGTMAFFFIGHNDLCNANDDPKVIADRLMVDYKKALAEWNAKHEGAVAYLLPIADVHRVFHTLKGYVWHKNGTKRYACEDSWERLFPYCPSHAKKLKAGTIDDYFVPRLREINRAIGELATELNRASGGKNRFAYAEGIMSKPFEADFFAVDCYHLSAAGQKRVADGAVEYLATKPN